MKRFTDTEKWKDPWFRKLSGPAKMLWFFLTDNADRAGVCDLDFDLASEDCRMKIGPEHLAELGSRVQVFRETKILIGKFIPFQYKTLSTECVAQKGVFDLIEYHGLVEGEDGIWFHPEGRQIERPEKPKAEPKPKPKVDSKARPQSREELDEFFRAEGLLPRDAEYAWQHWEANGWTNGGRPIKDWKATVRTWKSGGYWPTQKNRTQDEKQWGTAAPAKPSWLPDNWKEIAVRIVGPAAEAFASHTEVPASHRYEFEAACRNAA